MKLWLIWVQADGDTWLEDAWTDDQTAENNDAWREAVEKARANARQNDGEMRIQAVRVPGVFELFEIPEVTAEGEHV